jgi:hypothetical protein
MQSENIFLHLLNNKDCGTYSGVDERRPATKGSEMDRQHYLTGEEIKVDPNAVLRGIRELVKDAEQDRQNEDYSEWDIKFDHLTRLCEHLDNWILKGGFLPDSWEVAQKKTNGEINGC